jgi:hypothetical protein
MTRTRPLPGSAVALCAGLIATGGTAIGFAEGGYCSATARTLYDACGFEVQDDYAVASAICMNVSDRDERAECYAEAKEERQESRRLCREQRGWRLMACKSLGEDRYDPDFDPAFFETDFSNLQHPNDYFPLSIGNFWEYAGGREANTVEVLPETKLIDGVTCVVVNDQVFLAGELVEDTDDWFAQAIDGNVWYCGEEVKDYESFDGDSPRKPELTSVDGSFKAGRDRDKPGIIFRASPLKNEAYLEEFSLGNAEDVTEILSTDYTFGSDPELDLYVPQELADLLCASDCVVTKNFSLLEPAVVARKYYARGIGFFLEVDPDSGEISRLVSCNFDGRCALLPSP